MKKVCATGPGSAMPVVSMTTRSKSSSPLRFFSARSASVVRRSSRIVQQTHPLLSWMICSLASWTRISLSMFSSPNSFSMTAIFCPCASVSTRFRSVVLPEPRKPVRMVAGIRAMGSPRVGRTAAGGAPDASVPHWGDRRAVQGKRAARARKVPCGKLPEPCRSARPGPRPSPMSDLPAARATRGADKSAAPAEKRPLLKKLLDLVARGPDSRDQLISQLADFEQKELIEPESRMMLEGVIRMADMTAGDVMVPSPHMDLLDIDAPYEEMLHVIIHTGHSRFPVFEERRDNIIGVLMAKDLLKLQRSPTLSLRTLLRPAFFVPESKGLNELLRDFRTNRNHIAIVIDEFGHNAGLLTLEDVLEEIVGEIEDEFDEREDAETSIYTLADGSQRVAGDATVAAVNEAFDVFLPTDEFDTIGGLVAHELGRVPRRGEAVTIGGLVFAVMLARGGAVRWFKVTRAAEEALGSDGA